MRRLDCREFEAKLWVLLDGELDADACAELRAHLKVCWDCWNRYRFEDTLRMFVRRCCQERVPDSFRRRLFRRIFDLNE